MENVVQFLLGRTWYTVSEFQYNAAYRLHITTSGTFFAANSQRISNLGFADIKLAYYWRTERLLGHVASCMQVKMDASLEEIYLVQLKPNWKVP